MESLGGGGGMPMRLMGSSKLRSAGLVVAAALLMAPLAAVASHLQKDLDANLRPVPHSKKADGGSQVKGDVDIEVKGRKVEVEVEAWGLAPNLVHAQHIHGIAADECPGPERRDDLKADGLISTLEGVPDYGGIAVSLTTKGDTSPNSGLAVDRFPVADKQGRLDYERTFWVGKNFPKKVARNIEDFHIVVHGIDTNNNDVYDFSAGKSDLDPSLPEEATVPATCGLLRELHHH
jgi:hypothetical protein